MFQNYFKIAFRTLWKKRTFSFLNILGLTIGITASLLIFLVIHYETSYDSFQSRGDRIYRVVTTYTKHANGEVVGRESAVPVALSQAMQLDFPQLEKVAPVWNIGGAQVHVPGKKGLEDEHIYKENDGLYFTEPDLFNLFDYQWLDGNATALNEPNTVVLTRSLANTYFGSWKNAMGKTVEMWSYRIPFRVVGVFEDLPVNTDMQVKYGASYATFRNLMHPGAFTDPKEWQGAPWPSECFVLLKKDQQIAPLQAQLPKFVQKYFPEEKVKGATITSLSFQPLREMHLDERFYTFKSDALTHKELWSLGLIGAFLLIVACINFINLATAQSVSRAKEIGVRKVLGSPRSRILGQFLNETALITTLATVLGCLLAWACLPFLSDLMRKPLALDLLHNPAIIAFLIITAIIVTALAGFYPGLVLSGFNPIEAIKSRISAKTVGGISLRRGLVVLQFVIAQLLIIGTMVVVRQMKFFRSAPMGFEKKAVAMVELPSDSTDRLQYNYLKDQVLRIPGVAAASFCMDAPAAWGAYNEEIYFDTDPIKKGFSVAVQLADTSYLNTFRIPLVAGRLPYPLDTLREIMINETLVKQLGLKSFQEALGKTIAFTNGRDRKYTIVGIIHDFSNKSLREQVHPLILAYDSHSYNYIAFRMDPEKMPTVLPQVQKAFTHLYPYYIYDLNFLDERVESFYHAQFITSQLFKVFAFLAIFISCLGLYGLVSYMALQKTKEVGIRKVLGASVHNIVYLFSREFTWLIGAAFLISAPLAWYFMQRWLSDFYYHITLGWEVFGLAMALSIVIAWATVGYKAIRAALANPVKSLRTGE
ncbi:MAG TPA: ABC transporter permease [Puia sp.]|nr:ABC transporter permease [Puia sp.]